MATSVGPSIKYVTLFLANFDPSPLSHFVTHPGTPQKVRHTSRWSRPQIFSRPSTKSPLYKFSLNCSQRVYQRVCCLEGFVQGGFCPFPFCQNTSSCYNRKLKITKFHVSYVWYKSYKRRVTCSLPPSPLSQTVTPSRTPLERDVLYGRTASGVILLNNFFYLCHSCHYI